MFPVYRRPPRLPLFLAVVFSLLLAVAYLYISSRPPYALYTSLFDAEVKSSRQVIKSSANNKYVMFRQLQGAGFNNQAQEILLFHHLALLTSRIYVYQPLVWRPRGENSLVPLTAFLLGPTKNSITSVLFNEACYGHPIKHVKLRTEHMVRWDHAKQTLSDDAKCIQVDDWIFDWSFLASPGLHHIWPSFQSYLANHFEWSEPILAIVERSQTALNLRSKGFNKDGDAYMALHLRRGDFEEHCKYLAEDHMGFTTWGTLPILRSSIFPPTIDVSNATSVTEHCYPSLRRILAAVSNQAKMRPHLRTLHVLHDGAWDHPLVYLHFYKLVEALTSPVWAQRQGWPDGQPMKRVTHSAMVPISRGEGDWKVAVDVELARRAEAFIGNGYSSLSTQVVALRLGADQGALDDNMFY
ncbi:hypothetical protein AMATHDRAFT_141135 [Amanita thiersii Skay4041]|uniref:Glycosyltransferase family 23 protein n=1 Tax=Amanita thiersii Skay4041 TaxID=703135 RepID=A0A2A9NNH1_9AGAR|nr:hypothetical protein AMATHDRAFT_141135 [Amanita thiersii Skay4041]